MKKLYTRMAALLPIVFLFVAALQAQTYQPVVTSANGCSAEGTYNYTAIVNGKPSYTLAIDSNTKIFWGNNKWNIAFVLPPSFIVPYFENTADTPCLPVTVGWMLTVVVP